MVMQNKAVCAVCASEVLINSQYTHNMHAENWYLN